MKTLCNKILVIWVLVLTFNQNLFGQGKRDLAKIRKTAAANLVEPTYENEPKYSLVLVGPDGTKKIWMVLDGFKTIYADINDDGKLDTNNEKFLATEVSEYPKGQRNLAKHRFELGEVDGHTLSFQVFVPSKTYESRSAIIQKHVDQQRENGWVRCWLARSKKIVKNEGMTGVAFTPKAEDAQVTWLGGPVQIIATDRDLRPRKKLGVALPTDSYTVTIGSVGLPVRNTKGTVITPVMAGELPEDLFPIARFRFESGVVEVELNQLRSRGQISGQFLLPAEESIDEVEVEIGYPESARSNIKSTTQKIPIK